MEETIIMGNKDIIEVDINMVEPNNNIVRKSIDEDFLQDLAESIKEHGVITPLIVTKEGDKYRIVAGERRWRAAKMAGLNTIPVIINER